ncbi:uncharacterized protein C2845_PM16G17780 [Panicum miliaceum]|uniref:Phorbol-ester/DAG-type domain-containing protein n=1 Tax=Panicum miliaceum TaxID=4540 RepID=A0A3L6PSA1_PANMI|nr:uncharacterized protein C2845_PM16G17780 [Panicum miliaceum]
METMSQDGYTLAHISHLHDLHLADIPAGAPPPRCHACGLDCARSAYRCAPCGYALHPACARTGRTRLVLHCHHCQFDLHLPCAALPADAVAARAHRHPLSLAYDNPHRGGGKGMVVICTVCEQGIIPEQWFYRCSACADFAGHVGCVVPDALAKGVYARVDMHKVRAEREAGETAALLQQYQQMSARSRACSPATPRPC